MVGDRQVALVTGASSGIGAATASRLAREGLQVIMVARRKAQLEGLAEQIRAFGGTAHPLPADLSLEGECLRVHEAVRSRYGNLDVLVNNAGLAWYGYGEQMPWDTARQMIEVNMAALTRLTFLYLAEMKQRRRGHIINMGSIVASIPSQGVALYSATKSFVNALTTSLGRELRGTNVHLSVVRSGAVKTPFFDTTAQRPGSMRIPVEWLAVSPEAVAQRVWQIIRKPVRVAYVPRILVLVPWLELGFGWLMDRLGPLLLRYQQKQNPGPLKNSKPQSDPG